MAPSRWLLGLLCLGWLGSPAEADLLLTWTFPHTLGPQPWYLTMVGITTETPSLTTRTLEPLDDARCRQQLGQAYEEGESWCARLACPSSGAYQFVLQAKEDSAASEPLAVGIATPPCALVGFDEALTVAVPVRLPPPVVLAPPLHAPVPATPSSVPPSPIATVTPPPVTPATSVTPAGPSPAPHSAGPVSQGPSAPGPSAPTPVAATGPPPVPAPAPATVVFGDEAVPGLSATDAGTSDQFVQAFAHLAQRYGAAMDQLVAEYNAVYDAVVAHPTPAGQRRLERAYQQGVQRQQEIYAQATQAWERLYAAWQQFILTPPRASNGP